MVSVCQQIESNNQDFNHGSVFCQHKWVLWVEFGLFSHVNVAEHDILSLLFLLHCFLAHFPAISSLLFVYSSYFHSVTFSYRSSSTL